MCFARWKVSLYRMCSLYIESVCTSVLSICMCLSVCMPACIHVNVSLYVYTYRRLHNTKKKLTRKNEIEIKNTIIFIIHVNVSVRLYAYTGAKTQRKL